MDKNKLINIMQKDLSVETNKSKYKMLLINNIKQFNRFDVDELNIAKLEKYIKLVYAKYDLPYMNISLNYNKDNEVYYTIFVNITNYAMNISDKSLDGTLMKFCFYIGLLLNENLIKNRDNLEHQKIIKRIVKNIGDK